MNLVQTKSFWLVFALVPVLGCEPHATSQISVEDPHGTLTIVGEVNGSPLYLEEIQPLVTEGVPLDRALEVVVARRLAAGLGTDLVSDPVVAREIALINLEAKTRTDGLIRDTLFLRKKNELTTTDSDIESYYDENRARFFQRTVTVDVWELGTERMATAAASNSEPITGSSRRLGPVTLQELPKGFGRAVIGIEEVGGRRAIECDEQWCVVELVDRASASPIPLERVRERIAESLRTQRAQRLVSELIATGRAKARVSIDRAVIDEKLKGEGGHSASAGSR